MTRHQESSTLLHVKLLRTISFVFFAAIIIVNRSDAFYFNNFQAPFVLPASESSRRLQQGVTHQHHQAFLTLATKNKLRTAPALERVASHNMMVLSATMNGKDNDEKNDRNDRSIDGTAPVESSSSPSPLLSSLTIATSFVTLYSEIVLGQTGCGLPAGPYGLVGLIEGLSYLGVVGAVLLNVSALLLPQQQQPRLSQPATFMTCLAAGVGLLVLFNQVTVFGYIPNAVPMEGGMCK